MENTEVTDEFLPPFVWEVAYLHVDAEIARDAALLTDCRAAMAGKGADDRVVESPAGVRCAERIDRWRATAVENRNLDYRHLVDLEFWARRSGHVLGQREALRAMDISTIPDTRSRRSREVCLRAWNARAARLATP